MSGPKELIRRTRPTEERHHLVAPVIDYRMYERCIHTNPFLADERLTKHPVNNKKRKVPIGVIYNEFLGALDPSEQGWLIFCHEDFEFLENPLPRLEYLEPHNLYGVFGARLKRGTGPGVVLEYIGKIFDCDKNDDNQRVLGTPHPDGAVVDSLDCLCLMAHSSVVAGYGLRFDHALGFNLYVEDFCLMAALKHNLPSRVLRLRCRHHSQIAHIEERPSYEGDLTLLQRKYQGHGMFACTCGTGVINAEEGPPVLYGVSGQRPAGVVTLSSSEALPASPAQMAAARLMKSGSLILDAGNAAPLRALLPDARLFRLEDVERCRPGLPEAERGTTFVCDFNDLQVQDLGFLYRAFEYVYLGGMPGRSATPVDLLNTVRHFCRPDGKIVAEFFHAGHVDRFAPPSREGATSTLLHTFDGQPERMFTPAELAALLGYAEFLITEADVIYKKPSGLNQAACVRLQETLCHSNSDAPKFLFVKQYVVALIKVAGSAENIAAHNLHKLMADIV